MITYKQKHIHTDKHTETNTVETNTTLSYISISINDVWTSLTSLVPSKAPGIDNLNPKVFKYCATSLSEPIHNLFCQSDKSWPITTRVEDPSYYTDFQIWQ